MLPVSLLSKLDQYPCVIVPGLGNSGDQHWQSLWQDHMPNSERIKLSDWDKPDLAKWKLGIIQQLDKLNLPAVLIAHSFGALASVSIAAEHPEKVAALFLVAPADPDKFGILQELPEYSLPVPTKLIASSNDPWLEDTKAAYLALQWGADFLCLENAGHINSDSKLGMWHEGLRELKRLIGKIVNY
jgi:uncharacterized protein